MSLPERWWDDVEKAQHALSIVGGDDVAQSVGTVALGYHAMLVDRLRPLAARTLVDHQDVADALDEVDLTPVAKAMSAAVSPVLGNAAAPYAVSLVDQLHDDARESLRHELTALISKGVAWPQAIERVCGVAGVPVRAVNGYVQKMAAPNVNPKVLVDEGDRTLMTWASRLGRREATPVLGEVVKQEREWDPGEHPRDQEGRFADAPEAGSQREARLTRLQRLQRLSGLQRRAEEQKAAERVAQEKRRKEKTLADLQAEVLGRAGARAQGARAQGAKARGARAQGARAAAARAQGARQEQQRLEVHDRPIARATSMGYQLRDAVMIDVDPHQALFGQIGDIVSGSEIGRLGDVEHDPGEQPPGAVRLIIDQAYVAHDNGDGSYEMDPGYQYRVADVVLGGPYGRDMIVQLVPLESENIHKAEWEEAEHPRDDDGRFADADTARRQRLGRLARLQGLASRQAQRDAAVEARVQRAREAEDNAAAAALNRPAAQAVQGARARGARARGARAQGVRAQSLRATGRTAADEAQEAQSDVLGQHRTAMLLPDDTIARLTDHYPGDVELADGIWLSDLQDTPSERRAMFRNVRMMNGDEVSGALAKDAWRSILRRPAQDQRVELHASDQAYGSAAEALEAARHEMLGTEVLNESYEVYVPGAQPIPGTKLFRPVAYRQPLEDNERAPEAKSVVSGDSEAMIRLRNGDVSGLVLRRVGETGLDLADIERMGGGTHHVPADVEASTAVFEVVDTRRLGRRRA